MSERTQTQIDIIRQCSLKAAVELTTAFFDIDGDGGKATTATLAVAEKFQSWILREDAPNEQQESGYFTILCKEIHKLQKKLALPETDFQNDPCPLADSWENGGAAHLVESLRERATAPNGNGGKRKPKPTSNQDNANGISDNKKNGKGAGLISLAESTGYEDRGWSDTLNRHGEGTYQITPKQFGLLVTMHRRQGLDHDPAYLNDLTSAQASELIDEMQGSNGGRPHA